MAFGDWAKPSGGGATAACTDRELKQAYGIKPAADTAGFYNDIMLDSMSRALIRIRAAPELRLPTQLRVLSTPIGEPRCQLLEPIVFTKARA